MAFGFFGQAPDCKGYRAILGDGTRCRVFCHGCTRVHDLGPIEHSPANCLRKPLPFVVFTGNQHEKRHVEGSIKTPSKKFPSVVEPS